MIDLGLVGSVLVLAWSATAAAERLSGRRPVLVAALAGATLVAFLPVDGLAVQGYVRGHLGALSATSLVLLAADVSRRLGAPELGGTRDRRVLFRALAALALALYPLSLGVGPLDPYALGYGSPALVGVAGAIGLGCWLSGRMLPLACLAVALLGYGLGASESSNLWDYLLDPWVSLYAVCALVGTERYGRLTKSVSPPQ